MTMLNFVYLSAAKMFQISNVLLHLHYLHKILIHMCYLQLFVILWHPHQMIAIFVFYMLLELPEILSVLKHP